MTTVATTRADQEPPPPAKRRRRWWRWAKRLSKVVAVLLVVLAIAFAVLWHAYPFPIERFDAVATSPRITDREGNLMLEVTASDDQWRQPVALDRMSPWLAKATIAIEDQRFDSHWGVDGLAIARAAWQNVTHWRTVSGASTLTMQLCRMLDNRPRTFGAKAVESFHALQLERLRTKDQIMEAYLNTAPYGGNFRGVEAAALGYFGKHASELSLGESALLAGLPQSPGRFRPDRYAEQARTRRAAVLSRMQELGMITPEQAQQAADEPITLVARGYRPAASQAAWMALRQRPGGGRTTIDPHLQAELERLAGENLRGARRELPGDVDLAACIVDIQSGELVAMVASANPANTQTREVNGVLARRSPGSALKPFIYAAAFEAGVLGPQSTVYDVPITRGGWSPANFDRRFDGPLPAAEALRRSLNVPAILTAEGVGVGYCTGLMEACGVSFRADPQARAGLSVAVGGAEVRLLDLVNAYATLGRLGVRQDVKLFVDVPTSPRRVLDANVCRAINDILSSRHRAPGGVSASPSGPLPWFMWKTGTSSGRRDAWAVGHNTRYAIGVWVGRFGGAGDVAFVGAQAAEPLLAQLFSLPQIRVDKDPPSPEPLAVPRPLPPPAEAARQLRITAPANGTAFIAVQGTAVIHATANNPAGLKWFLNGKLLEDATAARLTLPAGSYELRCIDPNGIAASSTFTVR